MPVPISERVQKHRDAMKASGLRLVQVWVPDTRGIGFAAECRRQAALVAQADQVDGGASVMLDDALSDLDGWT